MSPVAIPAWTAEGVLPLIHSLQPMAAERSPYVVSLTDYVLRFGDTAERNRVLNGFLRYRAALHNAGVVEGFQWLDGSFLEHIEMTEGRPPNDIDVVTFYRLPVGVSQAELAQKAGALIQHDAVKKEFSVDAYLVHLGMDAERLTRQGAYWYSVWSHRRNRVWKGFVQVSLAAVEDVIATATLASLTAAGGQP